MGLDNYIGFSTSGDTGTDNPFTNAKFFALDVKDNFVERQLNKINRIIGNVNEETDVLALATNAITNLQNFDYSSPLPDLGVDLTPQPQISLEFTVDPLGDPTLFGVVDPFDLDNSISTSGLPSISAVNIPAFNPTPLSVNIPDAPIPENITRPGTVPANPGFVYPDAITISLPGQPNLVNINIPEFTSPTIADFAPDFPEFVPKDINTAINFLEPTYNREAIDEVLTQISTFFAGGSGIDPDIEDSLVARSRDREDRLVRQEVQQATQEWANKGYTAPPGMLAKRLDNIREEGTLKKLGLNREFTIKVHQDEIDNLRFAVQQGIAAENLFVQLFLAKVERLFEIQRLAVLWEIELYNAAVTIFQAQMEEVKIRADVYEVQVRAALFEIEVFKALIEGERIKSDINKNKIDAYKAEIDARTALVQMYEAQVRAVGVQADVFATEVNAFRAEVEAYAAEVGADKNRFDAYASRIRGEVAKVSILESEANAYQAEVQAIETGVRAEVAALDGEVKAVEAQIRNFEAKVRGYIGKAQVQLAAIQANTAAHDIDVRRKSLEISAEESADRVELAAIDATNRTNQEQQRNQILAYSAKLEALLEEMKMRLQSITSAGQLASTITAGALAAAHVGATVSGSGSMQASGTDGVSFSYQDSTSCSTTNNSTISFESTTVPNVNCP